MNTKIIVLVAVVVILVAAFFLYAEIESTQVYFPATSTTASTQPTTTGADTAVAISSVVGDQYSSLMQDQLNSLSTGQAAFNAQMQDNMANDFSQFYYS